MADGSDQINFSIFDDLENVLGFDITYDFESFRVDQEETVDNSSNIGFTVNTFERGAGGGGLIETERVLERGRLSNLVKMVVSLLHKELECKVEIKAQWS